MKEIVTEESDAGRLFEGDSSDQLQQQSCHSGEALAEWRSSDQVENGTPSTSPPYWDSDDDDGGLKPSDLYGKYTWKIENFSQINKREHRSDEFDVGGYKWYILIYPQGCDVCNHLSLFLCVANHDKLLPGWSHFAQFTIAVVSKNPKNSKYSDTLHRFWKKEHDWGWKKFMELSKAWDEFIDTDTLTIEAQVQVIRERTDRPFRCLDCPYRRELVRIYLTNVEQICRRFVEVHRGKLGKLIEDKARWSSFCAFWLGMDKNCRHCMSQEKTETILKVVVKNFFIEKEVTSTLVMDSLYSGLKALEGQHKGKYVEADEITVPIVRIEKEMFVLVDDVLPLLERAAVEPLPPKDEKGPQNRMKDETLGEESLRCDERRLTELGRRTIEIFILAHMFNKIEVAYQEAVSLKKQEELIREEEAAWLAETEQRAKRGAVDKEKKSKKKQAKQKRSNRKSKDKRKNDKSCRVEGDKIEHDICVVKKKDSLPTDSQALLEKLDTLEDLSDISDSVECVPEVLPPDSEDRDASPVNWDTDTSEMHPSAEASRIEVRGLPEVQNVTEGTRPFVVDDSESTSSSDSVPSTATSVPQNGSNHYLKSKKNPSRGSIHQSTLTSDGTGCVKEEAVQQSKAMLDTVYQVNGSQSSTAVEPLAQLTHHSSVDRVVTGAEHQIAKDEDADSSKKYGVKGVNVEASVDRVASLPRSTSKSIPYMASRKSDLKVNVPGVKCFSDRHSQEADRSMCEENLAKNAASASVSDTQKFATRRFTGKPTTHQLHEVEKSPIQPMTTNKPAMTSKSVMSRPSSVPLTPGSVPAISMVSVVPTAPILARSVSAAGFLGLEPTAPTQSHPPQSYRNTIVGGATAGCLPASQNHRVTSVASTPVSYTPVPALGSTPLFLPHGSDWIDPNFSFGLVNHRDRLQNGPLWLDAYQRESNRNLPDHRGSLPNGIQNFGLNSSVSVRPQDHHQSGISACTSDCQKLVSPDEFPHLDIINDLLDDENGVGNLAISDFPSIHYSNQHSSFPGNPRMSSGLPMSSCRFERTRIYQDDVFRHGYGAPGAPQDAVGNMIPQSSSRPYLNGAIDGFVPIQWQMSSPDLPYQSARKTGNNVSPYHKMECQNLAVDANGYAIFRPANGL